MSAVPTLPRAAAPARARVRAVPVRPILTAIVLVSTGAETLLARLRLTPSAFPGEYVNSQLARSFASGGGLRVRGVSAHFHSLLVPLLTAPAWLVHDVGTAYRLAQLENAFVMSLAAIPAYLIARRLGVAAGMSLAVAAIAVAGPQLLFVAMLESEPFAYPLALGAIAASVAVIERPTLRGQVLLLVLSALATLARPQLGVLPLCVAVAIVVAGLHGGRVRDALREQNSCSPSSVRARSPESRSRSCTASATWIRPSPARVTHCGSRASISTSCCSVRARRSPPPHSSGSGSRSRGRAPAASLRSEPSQ